MTTPQKDTGVEEAHDTKDGYCCACEYDIAGFEGRITKERERVMGEVRESKDSAYHERDMLVCALSKLFPAHLARHSDEDKDWEDDWRWIVYITLPTGQVSWHIHDSEREIFDHLEVKANNWDGHNTERKYQRLSALKEAWRGMKEWELKHECTCRGDFFMGVPARVGNPECRAHGGKLNEK